MNHWDPKRGVHIEAAIRRWEYVQHAQTCPDYVLERLSRATRGEVRSHDIHLENAEMEEKELAWRRQVEGPFR